MGWLLVWSALALAAQAQSAPYSTIDPVAYSDYILVEQEKVGLEFVGFSNVLLNGVDYKTAEARRQEVLKQVELSLRRLRNMAPFAGKTGLRDEAVAVFLRYKELYVQEYAKLATLVSTQTSTPAQLEEFYSYQVKAERKMQAYTLRLQKAQQVFAAENKMEIVANPLQEKFERILNASIYEREANLAYLGVLKASDAWWTAMQARDIPAMQTCRTQLLEAVQTSSISTLPPFEGNTGLKEAAQKFIDFYKGLAEREYLEIGQLLAQEKRSQADVTRINALIDAYNTDNQTHTDAFNTASRALLQSVLN
jgi:hypothetical protein